ncbi:hypothetical protein EYC84_008475 [Monilinia fructicola]|uniref:Uncharacterized protein n=1 Tax=Monilinia fructicola TaxID=38448 RepID=A0A5M9JH26_MONFR|nr:hypothetical protein EYC84_008475 [Monilinia fructicola]
MTARQSHPSTNSLSVCFALVLSLPKFSLVKGNASQPDLMSDDVISKEIPSSPFIIDIIMHLFIGAKLPWTSAM